MPPPPPPSPLRSPGHQKKQCRRSSADSRIHGEAINHRDPSPRSFIEQIYRMSSRSRLGVDDTREPGSILAARYRRVEIDKRSIALMTPFCKQSAIWRLTYDRPRVSVTRGSRSSPSPRDAILDEEDNLRLIPVRRYAKDPERRGIAELWPNKSLHPSSPPLARGSTRSASLRPRVCLSSRPLSHSLVSGCPGSRTGSREKLRAALGECRRHVQDVPLRRGRRFARQEWCCALAGSLRVAPSSPLPLSLSLSLFLVRFSLFYHIPLRGITKERCSFSSRFAIVAIIMEIPPRAA